jgi:hypothetical protein
MSNALHQIVRRALLLEGVAALSPAAAAGQKMAMLLYMARLLPAMYRDRVDAQKNISFGALGRVPKPINGMSPEAEASYKTLLFRFGDPVKDSGSFKKLSRAYVSVNRSNEKIDAKTGSPMGKWPFIAMNASSMLYDERAFPDDVNEVLLMGPSFTPARHVLYKKTTASAKSPTTQIEMSEIERTRAADYLLTHSSLTDFYAACLDVSDENSENPRAAEMLESVLSLILELADTMSESLDADQRGTGTGDDDSVEDQMFASRISESAYDDIFDMEEPSAQGTSIDTVKVPDEDAGEEENSPLDEAHEALQLLEEEIQEMRGITYWEEINDLIRDIREEFTRVEELLSGAAGGV